MTNCIKCGYVFRRGQTYTIIDDKTFCASCVNEEENKK